MENYGQLLSLAVIAVAFYLLMIRPQQKRQKEHQALMNALAEGDRVVTIGGMFGRIAAMTDETVDLIVADGVTVTYARSAVARKVDAALEA